MPSNSGKDTKDITRDEQINYLSFLHKAVDEINSSKDYSTTLKNVARTMVPRISDWCAVDIIGNSGRLERLATAHVDPKKIEKALEIGKKYPRDPSANSGTSHVIKTGEPEMFNGITDEMLVASAINEEHLGMMRALNFQSIMLVPIKSSGKVLGTLTFVWSRAGKAYSLADLAFAEILATLAGNKIENSRLSTNP